MGIARRVVSVIFAPVIWRPFFGALLVIALSVAANLFGIRLLGGVAQWKGWFLDHRWPFFIWRLCLYGLTAWGWLRVRTRLRMSEPEIDAHRRLIRTEVAAVVTVLLLESALLLQSV